MFCPNCGSQAPDGANNCPNCGVALNGGANNYGSGPINDGNQPFGATSTFNNGANQYQSNNQQYQPNNENPGGERKSKLVAGLLGIFVGWLGIHNFYLGNIGRGIGQIVLSIFTCCIGGYIWGLIEGIMILCGNINTDANGNPLTD